MLGEWVPYRRRDWLVQRCVVAIGDHEPDVRVGTHSMKDPAWVLPIWLRHATRNGDVVAAGTVVSTGTWVGVLPAAKGDAVKVVFDGIGEAALRL